MQYRVINSEGLKVFNASEDEIKRMVRNGQVIRLPGGRAYKLTGKMEPHECRTRISGGGVLAAMGMSQRYTTTERGKVDGFKTIFPEDAAAFGLGMVVVVCGHHSIDKSVIPQVLGAMP
jgi:hypothetical protein